MGTSIADNTRLNDMERLVCVNVGTEVGFNAEPNENRNNATVLFCPVVLDIRQKIVFLGGRFLVFAHLSYFFRLKFLSLIIFGEWGHFIFYEKKNTSMVSGNLTCYFTNFASGLRH